MNFSDAGKKKGRKWVYRIKSDTDSCDKSKSRFTVEGRCFSEIFSPTAHFNKHKNTLKSSKGEIVTLVLGMWKQLTYMLPLSITSSLTSQQVMKKGKTFYGIKQSGCNWNRTTVVVSNQEWCHTCYPIITASNGEVMKDVTDILSDSLKGKDLATHKQFVLV